MAGAIFVIAAEFAEHWRIADRVGFWESKVRVDVADGALLAFWVTGGRGLVGVCVAIGPPEDMTAVPEIRPWLPEDTTTYRWRYRFTVLRDQALPAWSWTQLVTLVGRPNSRAHLGPPRFDDDGGVALLHGLGATLGDDQASMLEQLLDGVIATTSPVSSGDYVYVPLAEDLVSSPRTLIKVDADAWDRGLNAHSRTQNLAATWLQDHGATIRQPGPVNSDLEWTLGNKHFVGEVKSLHDQNEREQLRLGLGQVLEFAYRLSAFPVLIVEQQPRAEYWEPICTTHGVRLVWPDVFDRLTATVPFPN